MAQQLTAMELQRLQPNPQLPWWRVGTLWLAFGGLAAVVVGSIAVAVVAIRGADTVLVEGRQRITAGQAPDAQTPALLARNHAAAAATAAAKTAAPPPAAAPETRP
jgi:uncharacterized protein